MSSQPWVVLKFGGNSVADLQCWQTIAAITQQHLDKQLRPLIVCSALGGITNKLENLIDAAINGGHDKILQDIIAAYGKLAGELSIDPQIYIKKEINELSQIIVMLAQSRVLTPFIHAKVLSFGEILLTKLGAAYLQAKHFPTTWTDARTHLKSIEFTHSHAQSKYLAAVCDYQKDETVIKQFNAMTTPVVLTQGFIASNARNETVLLGRGGSDTAAAYFAAKLMAQRCEIWTDVPGVYSANPHEIPAARLIKSLDYDEAQEIASMGGKVLHPYCIPPLKANAIPMYVGYTRLPQRPGTEIHSAGRHEDAPIKSILTKHQVTLIQIETVQMWHQVGFLADIFSYFKKHGVSVDLISTSETTVTISLDLKVKGQDQNIITALLADLNTFCKATEIGSAAVISIVGHNIRSVLYKIGAALKIFEGQKIYLVSQAANNLNFSLAVDESQAKELALKLHALLIEENVNKKVFDKSWQEEFL